MRSALSSRWRYWIQPAKNAFPAQNMNYLCWSLPFKTCNTPPISQTLNVNTINIKTIVCWHLWSINVQHHSKFVRSFSGTFSLFCRVPLFLHAKCSKNFTSFSTDENSGHQQPTISRSLRFAHFRRCSSLHFILSRFSTRTAQIPCNLIKKFLLSHLFRGVGRCLPGKNTHLNRLLRFLHLIVMRLHFVRFSVCTQLHWYTSK